MRHSSGALLSERCASNWIYSKNLSDGLKEALIRTLYWRCIQKTKTETYCGRPILKVSSMARFILLLVTLFLFACDTSVSYVDHSGNGQMEVWENPELDPLARAEDLVSRLTIEEKISQLDSNAPEIARLGISSYQWWNEALHGVCGQFGEHTTVFPQAIGLAATWNTTLAFQQATAISSEARALANARNNDRYLDFWSPVINIGRDPRWGRTQEGYGEDPMLVSAISTSVVRGLQGDDPHYFKVLAAPKHFIANNEEYRRHSGSAEVPEKVLRDYYLPAFQACIEDANAQSIMSAYNALNGVPCTCNEQLLQQILREEWGFEGWVVSDCGAIGDIHNSHHYTDDPLQAVKLAIEAGTDLNCGSYFRMFLQQAYDSGYVDEQDLDRALLRLFKSRFQLGVFDPEARNPYSSIPLDVVDSDEHRELALEVARQSIVLLENEGDFLPLDKSVNSVAVIGPNANHCQFGTYSGNPSSQVTPLEAIRLMVPDAEVSYAQGTPIIEAELASIPVEAFLTPEGEPGTIAEYYRGHTMQGEPDLVRIEASPNIKWGMSGTPDSTLFEPHNFSVRFRGSFTVEESGYYHVNVNGIDGIRFYFNDTLVIEKIAENYSHTTFISHYLKAGEPNSFQIEYYEDEGWGEVRMGIQLVEDGLDEDAVELARASDLVIMVGGTNLYLEAEGRDRYNTDLPEDQLELLKKLQAVNPNIVLVLVNGSTISFPWSSTNIPAIIEAWYPGQSGGTAIAEVLFGEYNPGGKLPMTFYSGLEQLPPFDDYDIRKGRTYMYLKEEPQYPFGYGLSYTSFEVSDIATSFGAEEQMEVSFQLQNTGTHNGSEVMQLYVEKDSVKRLKAFERVFLEAGESKGVTLSLARNDLALWDVGQAEYAVEEGSYRFYLGSSSATLYPVGEFVQTTPSAAGQTR